MLLQRSSPESRSGVTVQIRPSVTVSPAPMVRTPALREMDSGSDTAIWIEAGMHMPLAVIVAAPGETAVSAPSSEISATAGSLLLHWMG